MFVLTIWREMETKQNVECPVCCKQCKSSEINQHIDECLKKQTESTDQDVIFEKCESYKTNRKRKSDSPDKSGWGFLKAYAVSNKTTEHASKKNRISPVSGTEMNRTKPLNTDKNFKQTDNADQKALQSVKCQKTADSSKASELITSSSDQNSERVDGLSERNTTWQEKIINIDPFKPLAEQMRPTSFDDYIGHDKEVGEKTMLGMLLQSDSIPSMVLWGPPGCGKVFALHIIPIILKLYLGLGLIGRNKFYKLKANTW